MSLRAATPADLAVITKLLAGAELPTAGVEEHLDTFVVVETDPASSATDGGLPGDLAALIGVGGLEIHGRFALLRSIAVATEHRRKGVASAICTRLEEEAAARGVAQVYLLTETAEAFFASRGYSVVPRVDAPAAIAATEEFATLCPDSAVLMVRTC